MNGMMMNNSTNTVQVNMSSGMMGDNSSADGMSDMKMMDGHMMPVDENSVTMMMMQMTFYAGVDVTVLIKQWKVTTGAELFGTLLFWFLVAMFHQGFKRFRRYMFRRNQVSRRVGFNKLPSPDSEDPGPASPDGRIVEASGGWIRHHILQSLLQFIQTTISFILMLVFMTYNVWLALAILLGDWLGYLLFSADLDQPPGSDCCG